MLRCGDLKPFSVRNVDAAWSFNEKGLKLQATEPDQALRNFSEAWQRDPVPVICYNIGTVLLEHGRFEEAGKVLLDVVAWAPANDGRLLRDSALRLVDVAERHTDRAEREQDALRLRPARQHRQVVTDLEAAGDRLQCARAALQDSRLADGADREQGLAQVDQALRRRDAVGATVPALGASRRILAARGAGLAAVAGGVVLYGLTAASLSSFHQATSPDARDAAQTEGRSRFVGGSVSLAGGGALYLVAPRLKSLFSGSERAPASDAAPAEVPAAPEAPPAAVDHGDTERELVAR